MATVYTIEIVSDWIDYDVRTLEKMLIENLDPDKQNFRITDVKRM